MKIFSEPWFIKDNRQGYPLFERDCICSRCGKSIGIQQKFIGVYKDFKFSNRSIDDWIYCPYCGREINEDR